MKTVATEETGELEIASPVLTRMLVIIGQIAVRQYVHLEVHVYSELRRRARIREERDNDKKKKNKNSARNARNSATSKRQSMARPSAEDGADDDELEGAVADDDELELVRQVIQPLHLNILRLMSIYIFLLLFLDLRN